MTYRYDDGDNFGFRNNLLSATFASDAVFRYFFPDDNKYSTLFLLAEFSYI